jgi:hypothetical protein
MYRGCDVQNIKAAVPASPSACIRDFASAIDHSTEIAGYHFQDSVIDIRLETSQRRLRYMDRETFPLIFPMQPARQAEGVLELENEQRAYGQGSIKFGKNARCLLR